MRGDTTLGVTSTTRAALGSLDVRVVLGLLGIAAAAAIIVVGGGMTVALLLLGVIAAVVVTALLPGVLFAAYLLVPPFYKGDLQAFFPVDITVVLAILCGLQAIPVVFDRRHHDVSRAGVILWTALAFLILAGVLYAPDQGNAVARAANWWALAFVPILAAAMRVGSRPRYVREFMWTVFLLAVPIVVLGIAQLSATQRLEVLGANTIEVDRAALLVPLLGIGFILHERPIAMRWIALALIPPAAIVAVATGSRGPLLVLLLLWVIAAVRYLSHPRSVNRRLVGGFAGLGLISVLAVSLVAADLPGLSLERFGLFGDFVNSALSGEVRTAAGDTSAGTRVALFALATSLFAENPFIGLGTGGFEVRSPRVLGPVQGEEYPHNGLVHIAADYGTVGLVIFVALVFLALTRPLPAGPMWRALRVLFVYFLLNSMISRSIFEDRPTWGLLMLILLIEVPRLAVEVRGQQDEGRPDDPDGLRDAVPASVASPRPAADRR